MRRLHAWALATVAAGFGSGLAFGARWLLTGVVLAVATLFTAAVTATAHHDLVERLTRPLVRLGRAWVMFEQQKGPPCAGATVRTVDGA